MTPACVKGSAQRKEWYETEQNAMGDNLMGGDRCGSDSRHGVVLLNQLNTFVLFFKARKVALAIRERMQTSPGVALIFPNPLHGDVCTDTHAHRHAKSQKPRPTCPTGSADQKISLNLRPEKERNSCYCNYSLTNHAYTRTHAHTHTHKYAHIQQTKEQPF